MVRLFWVALASAFISACSCTAPMKCKSFADCQSGQVCTMGECRATIGTGAGMGGGGGSGGGNTSGGGTGGGSVVTGCDPAAGSANLTRDTDCDGLSDAEEYGTDYGNGAHTDPCNPDSDGDGIPDGVEMGKTTTVSTTCGTTFAADADPNSKSNPTVADTDGDGVRDGVEDANHDGRRQPTETDPLKKDTDCDGYSDGEELAMAAGCVTDGTKRDTDGDGLPDGVEGGLQPVGADPMSCMYTVATYDADSSVKTNPCNADTDGDGIQDGAEDTNLNGRVDLGELNPNLASDGTGVANQACATTNLRPINFNSSGASDVQVALVPSFAEVSRVSRITGTGAEEAGFVFYDATTKIAGLAISKVPAGADGTAEEADGRAKITAVSGQLTQTFSTWDGFGGSVRATYDVSGGSDAKARINAIVQNYLGMNATGLLQGSAGVNGPFKIVAEFVHRTNSRAVVVIALIPASLYTGQALFRVDDTAGGTALAQFGDFANTQCEVFAATVNAKVDFLWVVDDSCSMASSQTAVANAGALFGAKLANAGLDWRAAGTTTGWYGSAWQGSMRDWTTSLPTMQSWFSGAGRFGTNGDGTEAGFAGLESFMDRNHMPIAGPFRADAQAHYIFLTDTLEQSGITAAAMQSYLAQRVATRAVAHGIICPEGQGCGDSNETTPGKYHTLIRATGGVLGDIQVFNPTNPTAQQTAQQAATIDAILTAVIGGTGTQLQRPPISATIKVAVATTRSTCNAADVPRDRTNGWDIDAATRRLVFFGNCIPSAAGVQVAVSYKYWNDGSPDPNGDACGGTCVAPLVCDPGQRSCVCPMSCGGCALNFHCNRMSCSCDPDIG